MNTLTNTGRRRLGLPGRPAIVLDPGQTVEISDGQLKAIMANSTSARWVNSGVLSLNGGVVKVDTVTAATKLDIPEKLTGSGVELYDRGGGWWDIYVNGFKVLDKSVRRAKAEELAEEYR